MNEQKAEKEDFAIKFIPHSELKQINRKAVRAGRNSLSDSGEKYVIERQLNLPIIHIFGNCVSKEWRRCMVVIKIESGEIITPCIDIQTKKYEALPRMISEVDC
jgi:hypothetical protein